MLSDLLIASCKWHENLLRASLSLSCCVCVAVPVNTPLPALTLHLMRRGARAQFWTIAEALEKHKVPYRLEGAEDWWKTTEVGWGGLPQILYG